MAMGPPLTLLTVDRRIPTPPPNTLIYSAVLCPHWPGFLLSWSLHLLFSCPLHHAGSLSSRPSLSDFLVPPWLYSELCSVCLCFIPQAPLNAVVHTVQADSEGMTGQAGGALTSFIFSFVCAIYIGAFVYLTREAVCSLTYVHRGAKQQSTLCVLFSTLFFEAGFLPELKFIGFF